VVGLTNTNPNVTAPRYKQYRHVQYDKEFPPGETAAVSFNSTRDKYRYVLIQQRFDSDALCLCEVRVFKRGKLRATFANYSLI